MKHSIFIILSALLLSVSAHAQADRHDVRAGNRKYRRDQYKEAEIDYRKAAVKDSLSVAAEYNLASTLYRQSDYEGAGKALETVGEVAPASANASDYYFNLGDVALQKKDYASAVEAFKQSLLLKPGDLDAKENYIYAKLMLQNEQNGGGGDGQNDQNQDQQDQNDQNQQNQDQDQNGDDQKDQQDQNQDQNRNDRNRDQQQGQQPQEQKISPQQAQQMLQAIQAKEKETQDKVKKEKAELLKSRQKEKNW